MNHALQQHSKQKNKTIANSKPISIKHANSIKTILQPKLKIGAPNDRYEQEADRVADQVMRMPTPTQSSPINSSPPSNISNIQRKCAGCAKEDELIQKKSSGATPEVTPSINSNIQSLQGGGQPLSKSEKSFFEPRFGADFSDVRLHTDGHAANTAQSINARAFTHGNNVVFGAGEYSAGSAASKKLLAHELTHVIQQKGNGPSNVMRDIISANPSPSGGGGKPSASLTGCHVFLGGRLIDDFFAGTIGQFRHLYINTFESQSNYNLIEAGPDGSTTTGTSGAWVKTSDWDARGIQWDITPENNCPNFISCLKRNTTTYDGANHPYHYSDGPNSNSFAWWVLNECGLSISPLISSWPYLGVDYWQNQPASLPSATPASN